MLVHNRCASTDGFHVDDSVTSPRRKHWQSVLLKGLVNISSQPGTRGLPAHDESSFRFAGHDTLSGFDNFHQIHR